MGKAKNGIDFIGKLKLSSDTLIASIFQSFIFLFSNFKQNKNICANCFLFIYLFKQSIEKLKHTRFFIHFLLVWNHDVIPRQKAREKRYL